MKKTIMQLDRRSMLIGSGLFIAGFRSLSQAQAMGESSEQVDDKQLKFLTVDPRNGEPDLASLVENWITPHELFYVRSHAPNPEIDVESFRLQVDGLVERKLELSMGDLREFPEYKFNATLTCAGNRRVEFNEFREVGGVQWGPGAIGNATWTGIRLNDVLRRAGVSQDASHVWFEGLDEIQRDDQVIGFGASIPIEKATRLAGKQRADIDGAFLVYEMNDQPLSPDHGFPLRAVVPGYIGARSVKWLGKIVVSERPSPNHYVQSAYKIVPVQDDLAWHEAGPIYRFPINAAFAVDAAAELSPGPLRVAGYVLPSGLSQATVQRVELSADGGHTWIEAEFVGEESEFCWRLWQAQIDVAADTQELIARAADSTGASMPDRVSWNAKGYLQNSWYRIPVNVR